MRVSEREREKDRDSDRVYGMVAVLGVAPQYLLIVICMSSLCAIVVSLTIICGLFGDRSYHETLR